MQNNKIGGANRTSVINDTTQETQFDDFEALVNDIRKFCESNESNIVPEDDPRRLFVGFKDNISGKWWTIRILDIKKCEYKLLRSALQSEQGKLNLCKAIMSVNKTE